MDDVQTDYWYFKIFREDLKMVKREKRTGVTLIELLIVVLILAALSGTVAYFAARVAQVEIEAAAENVGAEIARCAGRHDGLAQHLVGKWIFGAQVDVTLLGTDGKRHFFALPLDDEQKQHVLQDHPG